MVALLIQCALSLLISSRAMVSGYAQSAKFEVATIKPSSTLPAAAQVNMGLCHGVDNSMPSSPPNLPSYVNFSPPALGRCRVSRFNLRGIIALAYPSPVQMPMEQRIIGGPSWIGSGSELYDIEGKAESPGSATHSQLISMLQALLIDRFKVQFHTELKEIRGFAITVAKNGPKLKAGEGDNLNIHYSGGKMSATNASIGELARSLASRLGVPIVDHTGLTGGYEFSLALSSDVGAVSAALQDELGLRFEGDKLNVEIMIIDHAEKPLLY